MPAAGAMFVAGFVALVAAAIVVLRYKRELAAARSAAAQGGRIVDTAHGPIEYAVSGAGVPLLSIHGAGGGFDQGLANAAAFVDDGFQVIAPSRFGYLRTPIPADTSDAAQADAHAALLAALDVATAIVVGVSAGARSAIELALRHPQRVTALVLIVPASYAPTSPVNIEGSRGSRFAFWLVNIGADFIWWIAEKLAPSVLIRFLGVRPELVAAASQAEREGVMRVVGAVEPLSLRFAGINIDSRPDMRRPPLERIVAPTLVISARDDLFNTLPAAEFAARAIPDATLRVFDTGGHLLVGRGQEVRDTVRGFLARIRSREMAGSVVT